jgi:hypothetical protein
MERELPLPVGNPKSTHGQFRHARLTDADTLSGGPHGYAQGGRIRRDGETGLVSGRAQRVVRGALGERHHAGLWQSGAGDKFQRETVWEFTSADVPDYKFNSMQIPTRLPNGNTLARNYPRNSRCAMIELCRL